MNIKYTDEDKEKCRAGLFKSSVNLLIKAGIQAANICALILVDGEELQARDLENLEKYGISRKNVWVISEQWSNDARNLHHGTHIVESELSEFLISNDCPVFDFVYFDFCKPFPNEPKEHHIAVPYNLFERARLSQHSVLATNFSVKAYFNNDFYRDVLISYVSPDYNMDKEGPKMISYKALSSGWNLLGNGLFHLKITPGDLYLEQKCRILMCFMDAFVRDMVEVYVPTKPLRAIASPDLLKELEEFVQVYIDASKIDPQTLPESDQWMYKKRRSLSGQLAQCANLLEKLATENMRDLSKYTGSVDELRSIAVLTQFHNKNYELKNVYDLRLIDTLPYPKDAFQMLPMVWSVTRHDSISSQSLWEDTRNMRETYEFLGISLK